MAKTSRRYVIEVAPPKMIVVVKPRAPTRLETIVEEDQEPEAAEAFP